MKIAQIAPLFESVPPQAYGGTERVVQQYSLVRTREELDKLVRTLWEKESFAFGIDDSNEGKWHSSFDKMPPVGIAISHTPGVSAYVVDGLTAKRVKSVLDVAVERVVAGEHRGDAGRAFIADLIKTREAAGKWSFVFIGAGGYAIHMLQKAGIPEAKGYGGFPVSGQFLQQIDWQPGDGWEPICAALDVPVPAEPFPHTNTTAEFRAMRGWD